MRKIDFLKKTQGRFIGVTYTRYGKYKRASGKVSDLNSKRVILNDGWANEKAVSIQNIVCIRHQGEEFRF